MTGAARPALPALTGLRFLAAMYVVAFHYLTPPAWLPPLGLRFLNSGYAGVSLFFVLSGFVLAYRYPALPTPEARRRFWRARLARIYPVYAAALVLSVPIFWAGLGETSPFGQLKAGAQLWLEATLLHGWAPWTACGANCPSWSLSVEAFFYAVFPVCVGRFTPATGRRAVLTMGALWLLALGAPALYLALKPRLADPDWLFFSVIYTPLLHLPQFLMGVVAGGWFTRRGAAPAHSLAWALAPLSLGLCAAAALFPWDYTVLNNGLLAPVFAALLYGLARTTTPLSRLLARPALVRLGEASYAVYILQYPVANWLTYVRRQTWQVGGFAPEGWLIFAGLLILAALASGRWLEAPARRWLLGRPE